MPAHSFCIFTDEKLFSPLPEENTERESEVNILIDASGSMGNYNEIVSVKPVIDAYGRETNKFYSQLFLQQSCLALTPATLAVR